MVQFHETLPGKLPLSFTFINRPSYGTRDLSRILLNPIRLDSWQWALLRSHGAGWGRRGRWRTRALANHASFRRWNEGTTALYSLNMRHAEDLRWSPIRLTRFRAVLWCLPFKKARKGRQPPAGFAISGSPCRGKRAASIPGSLPLTTLLGVRNS